MVEFFALLLATLAAVFGDIAFYKALDICFNKTALEQHEELGLTTFAMLMGLALWQIFVRWRGIHLSSFSGWIFFATVLSGNGFLLTATYFGEELVYNGVVLRQWDRESECKQSQLGFFVRIGLLSEIT